MKNLSSKSIHILNCIIISIIFILNYFYQDNNFDFTLKCICSIGFSILGTINTNFAIKANSQNKKFYIIMLLGLYFATLGDIAINHIFVLGTLLFAIGHIMFLIAFFTSIKLSKLDILLCLICASGSAIFLLTYPDFIFDPAFFKWVCFAYAMIISVMMGKAISNYIRIKTNYSLIIAIASILFYVSDLMLLLDWFVGKWSWTNEVCMAAYYPALCLLALSIYVKSIYKKISD